MSIGIISSSRIRTFFDVNPKLFNTSNTSKTLQVQVESQGDWTATVIIGGDFIVVVNNGSGDTNHGIFVDVNNNPTSRSATVRFTETSTAKDVDVVINQEQK